ncbi:fimbria/pilus outer membrane usher protein [Shewanella gaetbuli]|uniref:Fimbria/pilus outer membrane usher protein n=1 Tax=Shewanella gaetbuli TaxID=220752 RepID=A0A9X1ZFX4_9GAMM|nr:fimbria/pilus outer membrane usher protein [Shewanella gaetbuli]MCL1141629.1 fimbria/pilus outer membrane usher protein [Shewanella gaetbuli]
MAAFPFTLNIIKKKLFNEKDSIFCSLLVSLLFFSAIISDSKAESVNELTENVLLNESIQETQKVETKNSLISNENVNLVTSLEHEKAVPQSEPIESTEEIEFDYSFFKGGRDEKWLGLDSVNISNGSYVVDVIVNNKSAGNRLLVISDEDHPNICFDSKFLDSINLSLDSDFYKNYYHSDLDCYFINNQNNSDANFDFPTQQLVLTIPQAGIRKVNLTDVEWDYGSNSLRTLYNANVFANEKNIDVFASTQIKANISRWVLNGYAFVDDNKFEVDFAYATTPLRDYQSDFSLGRIFGGGSIINGDSMDGLSISSNRLMSSSHGYSPKFVGIANSFAKVTLVQNGISVHSETVSPGPFVIENVTLIRSGDVRMVITESDGTVREDVIPINISPSMLNNNEIEYYVSLGKRNNDFADDKVFISANGGLGFELFSLRAEGLAHPNYFALGASLETNFDWLGSVSFEGEVTLANFSDVGRKTGNKVSVSLMRFLTESTSFRVHTTYYDSQDYIGFSKFYAKDYDNLIKQRTRNEINISANHRLSNFSRIYTSLWLREYFGFPDSKGATLSFSANLDYLDFSLGATYSNNANTDNYSLSASVSVPFDLINRNAISTTSLTSNKGGSVNISTGISSSINDQLSFGLNHSQSVNGESYLSSLNSSYLSNYGFANFRVSNSERNITGSASFSGTMVAIPQEKTFLFSQNLSDTIAVVNVNGVENVKFNQSRMGTDSNGNVVIPLTSYKLNQITLDASSLPNDLELFETNTTIVPSQNAVVYLPLKHFELKRYILQVKNSKGDFVSAGTWAFDQNGTPLGFISNNGVLVFNLISTPEYIDLAGCIIKFDKLVESQYLQGVTCEKYK